LDKEAVHEVKSIIGSEVKELRKILGLTQAELGEKLGIDDAYISKIERGLKPISSTQLFTILSTCELDDVNEFVVAIIDKVKLLGNKY